MEPPSSSEGPCDDEGVSTIEREKKEGQGGVGAYAYGVIEGYRVSRVEWPIDEPHPTTNYVKLHNPTYE